MHANVESQLGAGRIHCRREEEEKKKRYKGGKKHEYFKQKNNRLAGQEAVPWIGVWNIESTLPCFRVSRPISEWQLNNCCCCCCSMMCARIRTHSSCFTGKKRKAALCRDYLTDGAHFPWVSWERTLVVLSRLDLRFIEKEGRRRRR